MEQSAFTDADMKQIKDHGLTPEELLRQFQFFRGPPPYLKVLRPCTPGDGIRMITQEEAEDFLRIFESEARKGRSIKFIPASGAASRMFKPLLRFSNPLKEVTQEGLAREASKGMKEAGDVLFFMKNIKKFAFFKDLSTVMSSEGYSIEEFLQEGRLTRIIQFLLTEKGLNYANLPKGLLKFHQYEDGSRSAFEEHLVEAAAYTVDQNRTCRIHFTVSPEHRDRFESLMETVRARYEGDHRVSFQVNFSLQKACTDTIAVDPEKRLFRREDGRILFRPGGHGSLIENLNGLSEDIVFIKNIDNVVPDRLKEETFKWKKILTGHLITIQSQIFRYLKALSQGAMDKELLDQAMLFAKHELSLSPSSAPKILTADGKRDFLREKLNRPLRVCGMVRNVGEPGGGPFWVTSNQGERSLQIVEVVQIDPNSEEQMKILASSTHFNPVDLVCGVRDWRGKPFDLRRFVDPKAVFISKKSAHGKELKALELPGLWNGAMAHWNTIFVEVPSITFNPVKTVNDLLRKEHQPE